MNTLELLKKQIENTTSRREIEILLWISFEMLTAEEYYEFTCCCHKKWDEILEKQRLELSLNEDSG